LSAAETQNYMAMLLYQQQKHKTTWLCYSINSSNTKSHDHIALSAAAAATRNHMAMLLYQQQQHKTT